MTKEELLERKVGLQWPINNELNKLRILLQGLANQKHKPIFWDELKIRFSDSQILRFDTKVLCEIAFNLAILDFYNIDILKKIFQSDVDLSNDSIILWKFCKLWQKLQTIPNYSGSSPSKTQLENDRVIQYFKFL